MFYPETLEFLAENCFMNSRAWFEEHKAQYRKFVRDPLTELAIELTPTVEEIDSQFITHPISSVSRINRDMRYARGNLYRDMLWVTFRRDRHAFPAWPEMFFIISPQTVFYGCGYYCTKAPVMAKIRELIINGDPKFLCAKAVLEEHSEFEIGGDMYKRSKFSDQPEELRRWLDRKTIRFVYTPKSAEELFAPDLAERIKETFSAMRPVYEFFVYAEELTAADEK